MSAKLNQIIAVANGKKASVDKVVTEIYHQIQKDDQFKGLSRVYSPLEEDGETIPSENKLPQLNVLDCIDNAAKAWTDLFDVVATQDTANTVAKADVLLDGVPVLKNVPVTHLLFLEKQLVDVQTFVSKLPVLDPADKWEFDSKVNYYRTDITKTNRSIKKPYAFVKAPATDKHPAQVDVMVEDKKVGEWELTKFSSCLDAKYKREVLDRVKLLIEAIKVAREEANLIEVTRVDEGGKIFDYLFNKK